MHIEARECEVLGTLQQSVNVDHRQHEALLRAQTEPPNSGQVVPDRDRRNDGGVEEGGLVIRLG